MHIKSSTPTHRLLDESHNVLFFICGVRFKKLIKMDLERKYKEETGYDVGKIYTIGITYYSDDYVYWLEELINTKNISNKKLF